jgi:predicted AAA+ superfamily ATPase
MVTIEIQDYQHRHDLLQFFSLHGNIIDESTKNAYLFDSNYKIVEGSEELIKTLLLPLDGNFTISYEDIEILLSITKEKSIHIPISNAHYLCNAYGKTQDSIFIPTTFTLKVSDEMSTRVFDLLERIINKKIDISDGDILEVYYNNYHSKWDLMLSYEYQQENSLKNLFLPDELLNGITSGIDKFIHNKERYTRFNIKYKLTYLLEGKPGMGKTSLVRFIANKYRRALYILNLGRKDLTDTDVTDLIYRLPKNSILLLEDFDTFYETNKNDTDRFSTLLNSFDGILSSNNGVITFITANNASIIPQKFLRPGRIDRVFHFGDMSREQFNEAWIVHIGTEEEPDEQLYNTCKRLKLSMSGLMHVLFYGETTEERIELAKQLVSERSFDSNLSMYS